MKKLLLGTNDEVLPVNWEEAGWHMKGCLEQLHDVLYKTMVQICVNDLPLEESVKTALLNNRILVLGHIMYLEKGKVDRLIMTNKQKQKVYELLKWLFPNDEFDNWGGYYG